MSRRQERQFKPCSVEEWTAAAEELNARGVWWACLMIEVLAEEVEKAKNLGEGEANQAILRMRNLIGVFLETR